MKMNGFLLKMMNKNINNIIMIEIDKNLQFIIMLFLGIMFVLYNTKSKYFFDENNNIKQFGTGNSKTILPFWMFALIVGLFMYVYVTVKNDDYV